MDKVQELNTKLAKVSQELSNMMKAQGNLYRFQEKVERQRTIYAQIAEVGHQFNNSLDFGAIVTAIHRFIVDHLNYERCMLFLPISEENPTLSVRSHAGFYGEELIKEISKLQLPADHIFVKKMCEGAANILFNEQQTSPEAAALAPLVKMDEFVAYSLGKDTNGHLRGFIIMGNQRAHFALHLRVVTDPENDALFSNITGQINAAQKTVKFMQAIQAETAQVKRLLNNMSQAVFTIGPNAIVSEPVSLFTGQIFEGNIVGRSVFETLFKDIPQNGEIYMGIKTVLSTVFGESSLQWELVEHQLPRRHVYMASDDPESGKILKIAYAPIWGEFENLEKIMFVIEDITEVEKLNKQLEADRARTQIIQEIASNDIINLNRNFFDRAATLYKRCTELVPLFADNTEYAGEMMRNLHTLKGNARMHGFTGVSKMAHESENQILDIKKKLLQSEIDKTVARDGVSRALSDFQATMQLYGDVAMKIFGIKNKFTTITSSNKAGNEATIVEIHDDNLSQLEKAVKKIPAETAGVDDLKKILARIRYMPLKPVLTKFEPMIKEVSATLGKKVEFKMKGEDLKMSRKTLEDLQDSLVHLIRNAIDHGIESPEDRKRLGKNEVGLLEIETIAVGEHIQIIISDDGAGIDPDHLVNVALKKNTITPEQAKKMSKEDKVNIIFIPGFSSKEVATELSGRGVGLDMVRQTLQGLNGKIYVESRLGKGSQFVLEVPN